MSKYFFNLQWHHNYCGKDPTFSVIQHYFCHKHDAHERICLSMFFCQYYCNSCSFYLIFCFKFYFLTVDIIASITFTCYFPVRVTPIQNVETKTKKTHSDIILAWLVRSVTKTIFFSDLSMNFANLLALPVFCIKYI